MSRQKDRPARSRPSPPARRQPGRPPTGIQELTRLSTFLSPQGRALLDSVCRARGEPIYRLLEDLVRKHVESLPAEERRRIEAAAAVLLRRRRRGNREEGADAEG